MSDMRNQPAQKKPLRPIPNTVLADRCKTCNHERVHHIGGDHECTHQLGNDPMCRCDKYADPRQVELFPLKKGDRR